MNSGTKAQSQSDDSYLAVWLIGGFFVYFLWHRLIGIAAAHLLPETSHPFRKYDALSALSASFTWVSLTGFILVAAAVFLGLSINALMRRKAGIMKFPFLIPAVAAFIADVVFMLVVARILDYTNYNFEPTRFLAELNSHPISWIALILVATGSIGSCLLIQRGVSTISETVIGEYLFNLHWFAMLEIVPWIFLTGLSLVDSYTPDSLLPAIYALFMIVQFFLHARIYRRRRLEGIFIYKHVSWIVTFFGAGTFMAVYMTLFAAAAVHF